ncbi:uncharacterized protein G2W53_042332 [Senna tora]|uniref:Uncharacterized protein n=1 Tax=Senna tora TaxID=362788 RepID=A0A834SGM6_9FABA|nr:uncharacterized protein G2W53_042332 [Senna tora]
MIARATQWRRARKESMMLLPVTSMEGVDDSTSYAVATSKEGVNDAASGDKHERFQLHARKESTMTLSKVPVTCAEGVIDDIKDSMTSPPMVPGTSVKELTTSHIPPSAVRARIARTSASHNSQDCEQRQQGRARGCVEGFDDGATEDSDNHVKLLPCSDIPLCGDKEMLKVILSVNFSLKTKQDGILCALKDALTECGKVANDFRQLECQKVHHFTLPGFHHLLMLHLRHVEGYCLLKSTFTLNLTVLVSCTLLAGGSRWLLFFCCYKVIELYPSAPSSLCPPYAWTPQFFVLA